MSAQRRESPYQLSKYPYSFGSQSTSDFPKQKSNLQKIVDFKSWVKEISVF
jgi:hypothetical protein